MKKYMKTNPNGNGMSERDMLLNKYKSARYSLIFIVALTAINVIFSITNTDTYFLFSIFAPYITVVLAKFYTGSLPDEFYLDKNVNILEFPWLPQYVLTIAIIAAFAVLAVYTLIFFMSKSRKTGWMIAALVLISIDTLVLIGYCLPGGGFLEWIFDFVFHAWMIYDLAVGIRACKQLNELPEENIVDEPPTGGDAPSAPSDFQ